MGSKGIPSLHTLILVVTHKIITKKYIHIHSFFFYAYLQTFMFALYLLIGNGIYDSGANAIIECLEVNKTLYDIYLRGNIFNPFTLKKMMKMQGENKKRMVSPQPTVFSSVSRVFSRSKPKALPPPPSSSSPPSSQENEKLDEETEAKVLAVVSAAATSNEQTTQSSSPSSSPPPLAPPASNNLTNSNDGSATPKCSEHDVSAVSAPSQLVTSSASSASLTISNVGGGDDLDIVKIPRTKEDFDIATVSDVVEWLKVVVGLDPDACDVARKNKIRGKTLWGMTKRDFTDCGFAFGDASAIIEELSKIKERGRQQAKRAMGFASADAVNDDDDDDVNNDVISSKNNNNDDKHGFEFLDDENYEDDDYGTSDGVAQKAGKYCNRDDVSVVYKGKLGLSEDYVPDVSCVDAVLRHEDALAERIPYIVSIVQDCQVSMESIKSGPTTKGLIEKYDLNDDEVFALVLYTYDIGMRGPSTQNFYYVLNETLRVRSVK